MASIDSFGSIRSRVYEAKVSIAQARLELLEMPCTCILAVKCNRCKAIANLTNVAEPLRLAVRLLR